jgi:predicted small metal-binding protein
MGWAIGCECGYVARGADEEELVADARRHARAAHRLELSREQILRSPPERLSRSVADPTTADGSEAGECRPGG